MNKRILKIFNEAGFHQPEIERLGIEHKFEKFAELIVRECMEQVRDEVQYEYDWKLADAVTKRVMEHFGVEE